MRCMMWVGSIGGICSELAASIRYAIRRIPVMHSAEFICKNAQTALDCLESLGAKKKTEELCV